MQYNITYHGGRAKARTVFDRSITEIMLRIPLGTWMYVGIFSVFMLSCAGTRLAMGLSPVQRVLPNVVPLSDSSNWKWPEGLIRKAGEDYIM
jgi:hypothetical protein